MRANVHTRQIATATYEIAEGCKHLRIIVGTGAATITGAYTLGGDDSEAVTLPANTSHDIFPAEGNRTLGAMTIDATSSNVGLIMTY